jgi:hypothetical protein
LLHQDSERFLADGLFFSLKVAVDLLKSVRDLLVEFFNQKFVALTQGLHLIFNFVFSLHSDDLSF